MAALEQRTATLDLAEPCARCGRSIGARPPPAAGVSGGCMPQYYLFPTGNAFHGTCLAAEVCETAPHKQRDHIRDLLTRLAAVRPPFQLECTMRPAQGIKKSEAH